MVGFTLNTHNNRKGWNDFSKTFGKYSASISWCSVFNRWEKVLKRQTVVFNTVKEEENRFYWNFRKILVPIIRVPLCSIERRRSWKGKPFFHLTKLNNGWTNFTESFGAVFIFKQWKPPHMLRYGIIVGLSFFETTPTGKTYCLVLQSIVDKSRQTQCWGRLKYQRP